MLKLTVKFNEVYDEASERFIKMEPIDLELEHSLVSISKWESKFEKAFLGKQEKTNEETLWYVHMMLLTPDVPLEVLTHLTSEQFIQINNYISAKMTATWFAEGEDQPRSRDVITSELLYYYMFSLSIPIECENWHLNRLLTLIKVFNKKNEKPKPMNSAEILARQRSLNAQRRAALRTNG